MGKLDICTADDLNSLDDIIRVLLKALLEFGVDGEQKETPLREKVESYLVSKVMRAKAMLGKGISTRKKSKSKKKQNKKRKSAKPRAVAVGRVIPLPQSGSGLIPILSAIAKVINLGIGVREAYKGIKQLMKEGKPSVGKEQKIGAGLFLRKQPNGDRYSLRVVT